MDKKIKPSQYMFLVTGFILGSILLISFINNASGHDTWAAFITGSILIIPFVFSYVFLSRRLPGKTLIEIHDIVYGKIVGKVISILYIFFFITLLAFNLRDIGAFYTGYIMTETPIAVFIVLIICCAAYAVKKGIHALAMASMIGTVLAILTVVITIILLLNKMDLKNFLPVMETPFYKMAQATATVSLVPYGELVFILMIIPLVDDKKKLGRYTIAGLGFAGITFLALIIRNTAVLGAAGQVYSQSSFQTVRLINIGDFINRIEIIVSMNNTILMFIKVSVLFYAAAKSLAQVLNIKTYGPLILPIGAIAIVYAMIAHKTEIAHAFWGATYAVFFEVPFVIIFPLLTLFIAILRGLKEKAPQQKLNSQDTNI